MKTAPTRSLAALAIAVALLTLPAGAGSTAQASGNEPKLAVQVRLASGLAPQIGSRERAKIGQALRIARAVKETAVQSGGNRARVEQSGAGNAASLVQQGSGHRGMILQRGSGNAATLEQTGTGSRGKIIQIGDGLDAGLALGSGERGNVIQVSRGRALVDIRTGPR